MDRLILYPLAAALACGAAPAHAADATADAAPATARLPTARYRHHRPARRIWRAQDQHRDQDRDRHQEYPAGADHRLAKARSRTSSCARSPTCSISCPARPMARAKATATRSSCAAIRSTADFFVDGVRDDVQYFRDFYNVDRVEVLKGPNAMIFGRGGGGGIVNRVLKRPSLSAYRQLTGVGRRLRRRPPDRRHRPAVRQQPASGSMRCSRTATASATTSTSSAMGSTRPRRILAGPDTRIDLSYEYFHDRRTADRGVPANGDGPLKGFTRTFFGDPGNSSPRPTSTSPRGDRAWFRRGADAAQPDDVRRLSEILPEHLRDRLQRQRQSLRA